MNNTNKSETLAETKINETSPESWVAGMDYGSMLRGFLMDCASVYARPTIAEIHADAEFRAGFNEFLDRTQTNNQEAA